VRVLAAQSQCASTGMAEQQIRARHSLVRVTPRPYLPTNLRLTVFVIGCADGVDDDCPPSREIEDAMLAGDWAEKIGYTAEIRFGQAFSRVNSR
jgi:hypothetical protein